MRLNIAANALLPLVGGSLVMYAYLEATAHAPAQPTERREPPVGALNGSSLSKVAPWTGIANESLIEGKGRPQAHRKSQGEVCFLFIPSQYAGFGVAEDQSVYTSAIASPHRFLQRGELTHVQYKVLVFIETINWRMWNFYMERRRKPLTLFMVNQDIAPSSGLIDQHVWEVDIIICKTRYAVEVMKKYRREHSAFFRILYTKHTSSDLYDSSVAKNFNKFLHVAGKSPYKHTVEVLEAWAQHPHWPDLTVIAHGKMRRRLAERFNGTTPHNVNMLIGFVEDPDMKAIMNSHGVHLCPSGKEGYGHYLNQARAVGALVITSNGPPMNELVDNKSGLLITVARRREQGLFRSLWLSVRAEDIAAAVDASRGMTYEEKVKLGEAARRRYLEDTEYFERSLGRLAKSGCGRSDWRDTLKDILE